MVYENVLAGAFIYSMGVVAGRAADPEKTILDSVNFFQQTPTDRTLGDLLAAWRGKSFLIEFKRSIGQLKDELEKDGKPGLGVTIFHDKKIKELSEKCHFIGYGEYAKHDDKILTDLVFQKYLSVLTRGTSRKVNSSEVPRWSEFINKLLVDRTFGASFEEFANYLGFLLKYAEAPIKPNASGGKGRRAIQGILTSVSPEGKVASFAYRGYDHLLTLLREPVNLSVHLEQQISYMQSLNISISEERKMDGPSHSFTL